MKKSLQLIIFMSVALFILSACDVYVPSSQYGRYGLRTGEVITVFEPDHGKGSTYNTNERIRFRIRTNQSGYVTLTAIDPDGAIYPLSRNIYVPAGRNIILPTPDMGVEFIAAPPVGLHRVRASFTPSHTNGRVVYRNTRGIDVWTQSIVTEVTPYPENSRDIVETDLYIQHTRRNIY